MGLRPKLSALLTLSKIRINAEPLPVASGGSGRRIYKVPAAVPDNQPNSYSSRVGEYFPVGMSIFPLVERDGRAGCKKIERISLECRSAALLSRNPSPSACSRLSFSRLPYLLPTCLGIRPPCVPPVVVGHRSISQRGEVARDNRNKIRVAERFRKRISPKNDAMLPLVNLLITTPWIQGYKLPRIDHSQRQRYDLWNWLDWPTQNSRYLCSCLKWGLKDQIPTKLQQNSSRWLHRGVDTEANHRGGLTATRSKELPQQRHRVIIEIW